MGLYDKYISEFYGTLQTKSPYQFDLEIMGRKPDIVPKVGDKVKVKSKEWYEKWKNPIGSVNVPYSFTEYMSEYCGQVLTVQKVTSSPYSCLFKLKEDEKKHSWSMEMFEEVYPQELPKEVECAKAFESLGITASALEKSLTGSLAIPAINPVQGIGSSYDLGTLSRQGVGIEAWPVPSPRTTLPQSCFCGTSVTHQDFFKKKEPELQTIKKHRFIKLEKL